LSHSEEWAVNRSDEVAQYLLAHPELLGEDVAFELCRLPVVYERASLRAMDCFENIAPQPRIVISLGEYSQCRLGVETQAHNRDGTFFVPDNAGDYRFCHEIADGVPETIPFSLPLDRMVQSLSRANLGKAQSCRVARARADTSARV
jgi:pyrrolidone-carboxylate peptidase